MFPRNTAAIISQAVCLWNRGAVQVQVICCKRLLHVSTGIWYFLRIAAQRTTEHTTNNNINVINSCTQPTRTGDWRLELHL